MNKLPTFYEIVLFFKDVPQSNRRTGFDEEQPASSGLAKTGSI